MTKRADIVLQNGKFMLSGALNFSNVMSVYYKTLKAFANSSELNIDFSGLKSSDSSGIALIIEWVKLARLRKIKLRFYHLPADLMSIARAAGMDDLIERES